MILPGVMHVDYEALLPYISEAIKQNYNDIQHADNELDQLRTFIDQLHDKFIALELKLNHQHQSKDIDEMGHEYPKQRTINTKLALVLSATLLLLAGTLMTAIIMISRGDVQNDQQRAVLLSLWESTSGVNWTSSHGWFSSDSYCSWEGITCHDKNIIKINLANNNLNGTIPNTIGTLIELAELHLENNYLAGSILLSSNWTQLTILTLNDNQIRGTISPSIRQLINLVHFDVSHNQISGTLPSELGELYKLTYLDMTSNWIEGTIPPSLSQLVNLTHLGLSSNILGYYNPAATIPPSLGQLVNLEVLELGKNQLSGSIPSTLGQLSRLRRLDLYSNVFEGSIPSSFAKLMSLECLTIGSKRLNGTMPSFLGLLTGLRYLFIADSQVTGEIPEVLGQLQHLKQLYLFGNLLTGTIPPSLGQLTNLTLIDISFNRLHGTIPSSLAQLISLTSLQLENNLLQFIEDFERPKLLQHCSMAQNEFLCPIPSWVQEFCQAACA
jgi:Leucine-rich repeat (LRR) protein